MDVLFLRRHVWILAFLMTPMALRVGHKYLREPLTEQLLVEAPTEQCYADASNLIRQMAAGASGVESRAARLEAFDRSPDEHSRKHRMTELIAIREDVDRMQETLERLLAIRSEAYPWQQYAIDHIDPAVVGLVDNLEAATGFLNEDAGNPDYEASISAIHDWATYLRETAESAIGLREEYGYLAASFE